MKTIVKKRTTKTLPTPGFAELEARVAVIEGWVKGQQARLEGARKVLDEAEAIGKAKAKQDHLRKAQEILSPIVPGLQWVGDNVGVATLPKSIPAGYKLRTKKGAKRANPKD